MGDLCRIRYGSNFCCGVGWANGTGGSCVHSGVESANCNYSHLEKGRVPCRFSVYVEGRKHEPCVIQSRRDVIQFDFV